MSDKYLTIPTDHTGADLPGFIDNPSVGYFTARMAAAAPGFSVCLRNQDLIAHICAYSCGSAADLSLAAEIAAHESLQTIAEAAKAADYDLLATLADKYIESDASLNLPKLEARILGFAYHLNPGFSAEAMRFISGIDSTQQLLEGLAEKSFLGVNDTVSGVLDGSTEKRFHIPITATPAARSAATALDASLRDIRSAHAMYFLDLAQAQIARLATRSQRIAVQTLQAESPDIESALAYHIEEGCSESDLQILGVLIPFWLRYGEAHRARFLLACLLDRRTATTRNLLTRIDLLAAHVFARLGEVETAGQLLDEAAVSQPQADDNRRSINAYLRGVAMGASRLEDGIFHLREALDDDGLCGAPSSHVALDLAWAEYFADRNGSAVDLSRQALAEATLRGDELTAGAALLRLAVFSSAEGEEAAARAFFERAMVKLRTFGSRIVVGELAEVVGSRFVSTIMTRACNVARILGAFYTQARLESIKNRPEFAVAYKEQEIREVLDEQTFYSAFWEGARTPLADLIIHMARNRFNLEPPTSDPATTTYDTSVSDEIPAQRAADHDAARSKLTRREREVAILVSNGLTNRQVASKLSISEWTVVNHMRQIMRKLGFSSRVQVASWIQSRAQDEFDR